MNYRQRPWITIGRVMVAAGVGFVGYILITSLPDLRRYIRISTM
jgi:hypothetical protein